MKYAFITNGVVTQVYRVDPANLFSSEYASQCIEAPDTVEHGWTYDGQDFAAPAIDLATEISTLVSTIDQDADHIYSSVVGNRQPEYIEAELQANAYKDAGYTGTVPDFVQAWATAKGQTATWAADDILATATAWRTAMAAIRLNRLTLKEGAKVSASIEELNVVKAQWTGFVSYITAQLAI